MNEIKEFKDNSYQSDTVIHSDIDAVAEVVADLDYLQFLRDSNHGFYFNRSLQIYGLTSRDEFNDLFRINDFLKKHYPLILTDEFFFSQDIFGNQFGFLGKEIVFFNIETGDIEEIADGFDSWMKEVMEDSDYYTGKEILKRWIEENGTINFDQRLCPKKPFVLGGEYEINNLYVSQFPNYITNNANIANQIWGLPDGTDFKIKLTE